MINLDELKILYEARPFKPFEIVLDDGNRIPIASPELVGWSAEAQTLAFPFGQDAIDWVSFARVNAIRQIPASLTARRTGTDE
jgi:hypothetical protein